MILAQIDDADSIFAFLVFFVNPNAGLLLASAQLCYRIVGVAKMDGSAKGVNMFLAMPITLFLVGFEAVVIGSAVVSIVADVEGAFFFMFGLLVGDGLLMGEGVVGLRVVG